MQMTHYDTQLSLALRVLLKRDLARRTITMVERDQADLVGFRRLAAKLRLNTRGMDRLATPIMAKPDLVGVSLTRDRKIVSCIAWIVCDVESRRDGRSIFH